MKIHLLPILLALAVASQAANYGTLAASLKKVLPTGQKVYKQRVTLNAAQAKALNGFGDADFEAGDAVDLYYTKDAAGKVSCTAVQILEILKRWKSTHSWVIGIAPDGKLTGVAPMELPDHYGQPLSSQGFLKQFPGKRAASIAMGKDFDAVSSATESSHLLGSSIHRAAWLVANVPLK